MRDSRSQSAPGAGRAAASRADRLGLALLLLAHGGLLAAIVGRGSPWATASLDCVTPTLAEVVLSEPTWSLWDSVDTAVGGQALAALAALPAFALFGTSATVGKALAIALSMGVVGLVWALLRPVGRGAAGVSAAGVAFAPPLVLHASTILGNWYYAQLAFDYGAALIALALVGPGVAAWARGRRAAGWLAFGVVVGLGVVQSPGSIPFLGLSCALLAILGRRDLRWGAPAAGLGLGVALLPAAWAQMGAERGADPTLTRLIDIRPDLGGLPGLIYPDLPWTLHAHDLAPEAALPAVFTIEAVWTACLWTGVALAAVWLVRAARRGDVPRRVWLGAAVPVAFVVIFAVACVALDLRIERLPWRHTHVREHTHRVLTPLLVALAVGAGPGWAVAWRSALRIPAPARRAARCGVALGAGLPPLLGAAASLTILATSPGGGPGYRGACFDVAGFKTAVADGVDVARTRCESLSLEGRRADCRAGVAWAVGYTSATVEGGSASSGATTSPAVRSTDVCAHVPPDLRGRCRSWGTATPRIGGGAAEACAGEEGALRDLCGLGVGWFVSSLGRVPTEAPMTACDTFGTPRDAEACWRGPGFALADHLHATPVRLAGALEELPDTRRAAAARGAGYSIGRTYARAATALSLCDALGAPLDAPCRGGVADARAHTGGGR